MQVISVLTPAGRIAVNSRKLRLLSGSTCLEIEAEGIYLELTSAELCFEVDAGTEYTLRAINRDRASEIGIDPTPLFIGYLLVDESTQATVLTAMF